MIKKELKLDRDRRELIQEIHINKEELNLNQLDEIGCKKIQDVINKHIEEDFYIKDCISVIKYYYPNSEYVDVIVNNFSSDGYGIEIQSNINDPEIVIKIYVTNTLYYLETCE